MRVLLLLPTTTYRAPAFLAAAERLGVEVVVASEQASVFASQNPEGLLALNFLAPEQAAATVKAFAREYPINAIIPVDEETAVIAAAIAEALTLPFNSVAAAEAARNKHRMRELLQAAEVPVPEFMLGSFADELEAVADQVIYPCVIKPLYLSASRGVIRADNRREFIEAYVRLEELLREPELKEKGGPLARQFLVERFIPGAEVALEGLLINGELHVLALFDKPDPLDGPFFAETIYVTPSRLPADMQTDIQRTVARAARALGLREGPVHAELRINEDGPWVLEVAARSIGGLCARTLRFGVGLELEDLILRHALDLPLTALEREHQSAGVMMLPVPHAGRLAEIRGLDEARALPEIEAITLTAHVNQKVLPLPEGATYLGFIFSRAETAAAVVAALRAAYARLEFVIEPPEESA